VSPTGTNVKSSVSVGYLAILLLAITYIAHVNVTIPERRVKVDGGSGPSERI
jgi:hypothetical protein